MSRQRREWDELKVAICLEMKWTEQQFLSQRIDFIIAIARELRERAKQQERALRKR